MDFTDKLMLLAVLHILTQPVLTAEVGSLVLSLWAIITGFTIFSYAIFYEFVAQLADLTAFNEFIEKKVRKKTMKLLEFFERDI